MQLISTLFYATVVFIIWSFVVFPFIVKIAIHWILHKFQLLDDSYTLNVYLSLSLSLHILLTDVTFSTYFQDFLSRCWSVGLPLIVRRMEIGEVSVICSFSDLFNLRLPQLTLQSLLISTRIAHIPDWSREEEEGRVLVRKGNMADYMTNILHFSNPIQRWRIKMIMNF